jgi:hypothetical protein
MEKIIIKEADIYLKIKSNLGGRLNKLEGKERYIWASRYKSGGV